MLQTKKSMLELIERLRIADTAYYKHDNPIMTDMEYDALYDNLAEMERKSGLILSGSPTQKVSGEVLEGLTLVLRYYGGKFIQAITRGGEGGMIGEDVTHTVKAMLNVPLTIPHTAPFEVRGEGVINWENFERINSLPDASESPYTHPRSLAAGSVRRLDASKTREQFLEFFAFDLVSDDASYPSKVEQLEVLAENGFTVVPYHAISWHTDAEKVKASLSALNPKMFSYPADGLIIEYDDLAYGKSLGATGHHENRLIALKWEDELHETTFLGLEIATTRTGMVSLTGIFEDVVIDGTTVNRAYLHNLDILDKFRLGVGDKVKIYKANMIIPQLAENITKSGTLDYPSKCPCCGTELVIRSSTNGTRLLFCENDSCPAKLVRRFVHFCSKSRMDIPDLSEKRLEILINNGWVKNFGDLFELERHRAAFVATPGFGEKLFKRITGTIGKRRKCAMNQFIAGIGIPVVGRSAGRILNAHFKGDWNAFTQAIRNGFDFTRLSDFGHTMHKNIHLWFRDTDEEKLWLPALKHLTFIKETENENMNTNETANNPLLRGKWAG